jgi:hypothetical protein
MRSSHCELCDIYIIFPRLSSCSTSANVLRFTPDEIKKAEEAFNNLGPTPRFCIDYVLDPYQLAQHRSHYATQLSNLSINQLKDIAGDWSTLSIKQDVSHAIFLIRREDTPACHVEYLQRYTIEPITDVTSQTFVHLLKRAEQEQRLDLYQTFSQVSHTRRLAGLTYEMIGHSRFEESEVNLSLIPMALEDKRKTKKKNDAWLSQIPSHELDGTIVLNFAPQSAAMYKWPAPDAVTPVTYYMPKSTNQVAFDSFVVVDQVVYMFQFTIATKHEIKPGIADFLSHLRLRTTIEDLRFVFVIPPGHKVECPQASDEKLEQFWNTVKMYSAVVDPDFKIPEEE